MGYDNTNKGTLNRNLGKSPDRPETANWGDYQGKCMISEPGEYYITGWIKTAQQGVSSGQKFMSLAFKKVEKTQSTNAPPASDSFDKDDPF